MESESSPSGCGYHGDCASLVLERRKLQKRQERERKRRSRNLPAFKLKEKKRQAAKRMNPTFRKMEADKSAARMRAKRLNPLFREAESAMKRKRRSQQRQSRDEKRLKDLQYIVAESTFRMQIDAVDPGLYTAGRVSDTNKDTTNHRKRISRRANNK